ncbi:MAG: molybdopterin converting factor subunit 1 [Anaerolineaceae bacterium]|nr:molybdopterin converting factor subunit 1 [Anaerolineaceae bacterium]
MQIKVLLFATLKDIAGQNSLLLDLTGDVATVADVRQGLTARYPKIQANVEVAIASVNEEYAQNDTVVHDGDTLAFFPPVSGGEGDYPEIFRLAHEPINHDEIIAAITLPETGAVCVFSGMVRGKTQKEAGSQETEHLVYEAYEPMAIAKMQQVAEEIRSQWPLVQGIAVIQRIGVLDVGQNTVLIACSSGHRDQGCFEAARYGIDRLKEIVPVWKKEVGPGGSAWVEGHYMPTADDRRGAE